MSADPEPPGPSTQSPPASQRTLFDVGVTRRITAYEALIKAELIQSNNECTHPDDPRFISDTIIEALCSLQDKLTPTAPPAEGAKETRQKGTDALKEVITANTRTINKARTYINCIANFIRDSTRIGEHTASTVQNLTKELSEAMADIKDAMEACAKDVAEIAIARHTSNITCSDNPTPIRPIHQQDTSHHPTVIDEQRAKARIQKQQQQILIHLPQHLQDTLEKTAATTLADQINKNIRTELVLQNLDADYEVKEVRKLKPRQEEQQRRVLLEMSSSMAANWLRKHPGCLNIDALGNDNNHKIIPREANLILRYVPTHFQTDLEQDMDDFLEANELEKKDVLKVKWIKDPTRRSASQTTAHLLVSLSNPHKANQMITEGAKVCNRKVGVSKDKKEPFTCSVCRNHGHTAREKERCPLQKDLKEGDTPKYRCGFCPGNHESKHCTDKDKTFCCKCNMTTHNSFDRRCPVFIKNCEDYDAKCPENNLPYFPTEEPYTWSLFPINTPRTHTPNSIPSSGPHIPTAHKTKQTTLSFFSQPKQRSTQDQPSNIQPPSPRIPRRPLLPQPQAYRENQWSQGPPISQ
jgi:hypothetical protein